MATAARQRQNRSQVDTYWVQDKDILHLYVIAGEYKKRAKKAQAESLALKIISLSPNPIIAMK